MIFKLYEKRKRGLIKNNIFAANFNDLVAQLVEQRPFKAWVLGSSPSQVTRKEDPAFRGILFVLLASFAQVLKLVDRHD